MGRRDVSKNGSPALRILETRCLALGWKRRPADEIEQVCEQAVKRAKRTHGEQEARKTSGREGTAETLIALLAEALEASAKAVSFSLGGECAEGNLVERRTATVTPEHFLTKIYRFAPVWIEEIRSAWTQAYLERAGTPAPSASAFQRLRRKPVNQVPLLVLRHDKRDASMQSYVLRHLALGRSSVDVIVASPLRRFLEDVRAQWDTAVRIRGTRHRLRFSDWSDEARSRKDQFCEVRIWSAGHLLRQRFGGVRGRMLFHDVVVVEELQEWGAGLLRELSRVTCKVLVAGLPSTAPRRAISGMRHVMLWAPRTRDRLLREVHLQCKWHSPQTRAPGCDGRAACPSARRARWCTESSGAAFADSAHPGDEDIKKWLGSLADDAYMAACAPLTLLRTPTISEAWCALRHAHAYAAARSPELRTWVDQLLCCVFRTTIACLSREEESAKLRLVLQETRVELCSACRTPLERGHVCFPEILPFAQHVLEESASLEILAEITVAFRLNDSRARARERKFCAAVQSDPSSPMHSVSSAVAVVRRLSSLWQRCSGLSEYAQEMQLLHTVALKGERVSNGYTIWLAGARSLRRQMAALGALGTDRVGTLSLLSCVLRARSNGALAVCSSWPTGAVAGLGAFHSICRHVRRPSNAGSKAAAAWVLVERKVCSWLGGGCILAGSSSFVARWSFAGDVRAIYVAPSFLLGGAASVACLRRLSKLWPGAVCTLQSSGVEDPRAGALQELLEALSRREALDGSCE